MKLLFFGFLSLFVMSVPELSALRRQYIEAAISEESAGNFHKSFSSVSDTHADNTLLAYKAASIVLMAKYEGNFISKTRLFNRGTNLLESVIKKDPTNFEARLIRLNIQDNVPWITGYTGDIKDDKAFLLKNFAAQPEDLKSFARAYIKQSGVFTEREKGQL
ncbi:hypothetical protein ACLI09_14210 [Flavobacterium sp. RHBU_24]|uniref:hypothetical protein n=1 Tax=Flavobacterium sp. RHBU_24 TaxID=3391185 RepID=UPI00398512E2